MHYYCREVFLSELAAVTAEPRAVVQEEGRKRGFLRRYQFFERLRTGGKQDLARRSLYKFSFFTDLGGTSADGSQQAKTIGEKLYRVVRARWKAVAGGHIMYAGYLCQHTGLQAQAGFVTHEFHPIAFFK